LCEKSGREGTVMQREQRIGGALLHCFVIGVCLLCASVPAFAQETKWLVPMHAFELGVNLGYFDYDEDWVDVKLDGFRYGVIGSYTYHNNLMVCTSLEYTKGQTRYDGRLLDGTPKVDDSDDYILEWRGLVGYDFASGGHLITPFIGVGYRYWNDQVEGVGGYEREVSYLYSPIGVKTMAPLSTAWMWGISAEYDLFWGGKVESHLTDVAVGYNDPEVDQNFGDGFGLRLSLRFSRVLGRRSALAIEPYMSYWDIDRSELSAVTLYGVPIGYLFEPENRTSTFGIRIGWQFR